MNDDYSWGIDPNDKMIVIIKYHGIIVMRFFLGEAMESAGRKNIMKHVKECDSSPWLHKWAEDAMEKEIEILRGKVG